MKIKYNSKNKKKYYSPSRDHFNALLEFLGDTRT